MGLFRRKGKKDGEHPAASVAPAPRGEYKQCDACGELAEISDQVNAAIFAMDISVFSLESTAGYCPSCGRFLCSKHIEFQNTSGGDIGPWLISCIQCSVPIQPVP